MYTLLYALSIIYIILTEQSTFLALEGLQHVAITKTTCRISLQIVNFLPFLLAPAEAMEMRWGVSFLGVMGGCQPRRVSLSKKIGQTPSGLDML